MTIQNQWMKQLVDAVDLSLGHYTFGKSPVFPLELYRERLRSFLDLNDLEITLTKADYVKAESILKYAGANPTIISLELSPISSAFYLCFSHDDLLSLSAFLVTKDFSQTFHEAELKKGFFKFFILRVLQDFRGFNPYEGLSLRLSEEPFVQKESYVIDIGLKTQGKESFCKMIIPVEFQQHFANFYEKKKIALKDRINFSSLNLALNLSSGSVHLTKGELKNIKVGDTIILDHSSYQPKTKKGYFKLSYLHTPLFQVKLKEDQLKLLDYIQTQGENLMQDHDDEELFNEEFEESSSYEEANNTAEELIDPEKIPLNIICEVGSFEMSLQNLLELKPGSIIPLSKRPEDGVYLTCNQKKIAKGELIQLGDVIGVKILETY